ncbi:hypothetical protein LCGC14_2675070, partial [marine sediment metagenome]
GAYLLLFRMFVIWRKEKKDIYDTIYRVKNNDIKHLKDRLDSFEKRLSNRKSMRSHLKTPEVQLS